MKKLPIFYCFILLLASSQLKAQSAAIIKEKLNDVFQKDTKKVLTCAHRGDWRNTPENSIQALKNCITMGVDIMELDLKRTKDGQLIVMHDNTIDRTVKGKGKPEDFTLEELKKFWLRNGTGHATKHKIPTFEEMMLVAKDKIIINIDKGYSYFDEVIAILKRTGTTNQVIFSITKNLPFDSLRMQHQNIPDGLILMPVIDISDQAALITINSYKGYKRTIFQLDFENDDLPILNQIALLRQGNYGIWINSLWPELCGGHNDDVALEENRPEESWGWIIKKQANVIQTDRPTALLEYLRSK